jgi:hypothetical protein
MPAPVQDSILPIICEDLHVMGHAPPVRPVKVNSSHPAGLTAPCGHDCT